MGSFQAPIAVRSSILPGISCGYVLQELQKIWDEIGEDQIEREKVLLDIEQECLKVYREKVDFANMARSRLHQELAESESEFTRLLLSLGERSLPQRPEKKAGTLRQHIESMTPALREMRLIKQERINQFHVIQEKIQKVKAEITGVLEYDNSEVTFTVNENDLSLKRLEEYQAELVKLQREKSNRLQKVESYRSKIDELSSLLGMESSMTITEIYPNLNELHSTAKNISDSNLAKLDDAVKSLEVEKQKRIDKLHHLGKALMNLWALVDSSERERQQFLYVTNLLSVPSDKIMKPGSLIPGVIQQAEAEVKRLDELKAKRMKELFLIKQFELHEMCTKSHMEIPSPLEMENITQLVDSGAIHIGDLLTNMNEQIAKAKEEAFSRKAILEKVEKWMLARDEELWLEEYNRDENRYSVSRGAHRNLKRAERARTMVTKIPDLLYILISSIKVWEEQRKKAFIYDEVPLLVMLEEYIVARQQKQEEKQRQRLGKKKGNVVLSPRPDSSAQSIPSRRLSGSPTNRSVNGSASSRRFSLSESQTGWSSFNPHIHGTPSSKLRSKSLRQTYTQSELGSHPRDETASVLSAFSGPLSPDL